MNGEHEPADTVYQKCTLAIERRQSVIVLHNEITRMKNAIVGKQGRKDWRDEF